MNDGMIIIIRYMLILISLIYIWISITSIEEENDYSNLYWFAIVINFIAIMINTIEIVS